MKIKGGGPSEDTSVTTGGGTLKHQRNGYGHGHGGTARPDTPPADYD
jgi:hypothetical protein